MVVDPTLNGSEEVSFLPIVHLLPAVFKEVLQKMLFYFRRRGVLIGFDF